jgi:hypothetical protein
MRSAILAATCAFVSLLGVVGGAWGDVSPILHPGALGGGVRLLPNGWKIAPAGRHVQVGSLPLAMVESLATEFGLLDNFYVDAEASYDGHAFSTY